MAETKNTIDDLRDHLFATLGALRQKDDPMELDRAKAVADVAKVLIESAKVEVDFLRVTGATHGTGFLPAPAVSAPVLPAPNGRRLSAAPPASGIPAGEACVLCGVRLETPYYLARGLCGSCSDRPEAKTFPRDASGKALPRTA